MPFALNNDPSQSEISEAINYLLANFGPNLSADPDTGQITGPTGIVIAYLYRYLAVKFADSFDGSVNFSDSPTNRFYYGVRNTDDSTESTNPADYIWYKVAGGFGTTNFLWYITNGGRQIQFYVGPASPFLGYATVGTDAIDLDIITSTTGQISFLAYFQPASLQVVRSGNPLTPSFTGVQPRLYASAGGALTTYISAATDSDPAFGNNTWRIGGSSTTGLGDITYNQITIGLPTDGGGYALWPAPTAMSGTPASLLVPVRYKNAAGIVSQANVAQVQLVFVDQGPSGDLIAYPTVYQWALSTPTISGTSTYTWSTGLFTPNPTSWSSTPPASTPGYTLYRAQVTLSAPAGTTTSTINWTTASVGSIGYAGSAGSSARICFTRMTSYSNPVPITGNITTTGSTSFPSSAQSLATWGFSATWGATDPNPSSTYTLYQADGIYDPTTNITTWNTPYISSLKVGNLAAISTNTGSLTISGTMQSNTALISGTTMTGSGGVLYASGNFAFGDASNNFTYNGSQITLNGKFVNAGNISGGTISGSGWTGTTTIGGFFLPALSVNRNVGSGSLYGFSVIESVTGSSYPLINIDQSSNSIIAMQVYNRGTGGGAANFYNPGSSKQGWVAPGAYSFYSPSGGGKIYIIDGTGPFTGVHDGLLPLNESVEIGDIIVDTSVFYKLNISNCLFNVTKSTTANQFALGVLSNVNSIAQGSPGALWESYTYEVEEDGRMVEKYGLRLIPPYTEEGLNSQYKVASINAVGEGQINVCGENGDIAVGDLIVTSSTAGKGMKQTDNIVRNISVAKARQAATFSSPTDIQQIACIYISG